VAKDGKTAQKEVVADKKQTVEIRF